MIEYLSVRSLEITTHPNKWKAKQIENSVTLLEFVGEVRTQGKLLPQENRQMSRQVVQSITDFCSPAPSATAQAHTEPPDHVQASQHPRALPQIHPPLTAVLLSHLWCGHMPGYLKKHVTPTELCLDSLHPSDYIYRVLHLFVPVSPFTYAPRHPILLLLWRYFHGVRCSLFLGPAVKRYRDSLHGRRCLWAGEAWPGLVWLTYAKYITLMLRTNLTWWRSKINSLVLRLPMAVGTLHANAQLGLILGSFHILLFTSVQLSVSSTCPSCLPFRSSVFWLN